MRLAVVALWGLLLIACDSGARSDGGAHGADGGRGDAGALQMDAGESPDAGEEPDDAGAHRSDASSPRDASRSDAGGGEDGGIASSDAGIEGDASTGPSECDALGGCCARIGEPGTRSGCETVVSLDMGSLCGRTLGDYRGAGWCTDGTACVTLGACCPSLMTGEGWRPTCERTARENNDMQCQRVLGGYRMAGHCAP